MNKRQKKKWLKNRNEVLVKRLTEMARLFVPGKIAPRKSLFSTWDEEYPLYGFGLRMPNMNAESIDPEKLEALRELHKQAVL